MRVPFWGEAMYSGRMTDKTKTTTPSTQSDKMREALERVKASKGGPPSGSTPDGKRANVSALKGAQVKAANMNRRTQGKGG